ncbi:phosphatase PAP2 family protein [Jeotgalibacillus salarius]|uniref:Phosphatase PAP2 family protein n=1 Tax=Jeotgalibacillus salarius TaxID=546023 RepID=A0A4Y8LHV9_9BACL|nr:phosphatase PAP2 family protein [Jeotgalibacillus salarius]TFE02324.1 phosphatase PAP2 family protein [Jeotgalibacillus salarius]
MLDTLKAIPARTYILIVTALVIIGGGFYIFAELGEEVLENEKIMIDQHAADFAESIATPGVTTFFAFITELGSVWALTVGSIIMLGVLWYFYQRKKWRIVYFVIAMGGVTLLISGLKAAFSRDRPNLIEQYDGTGYSFPSGHSTAPIVFYGFIIYLIIRSRLNALAKWVLNIALGILILLIAFSRLPLGVHYFTDVIGGLTLGLTWLVTCIAILEITLWQSGRKAKKEL